MKIQLKRWIKQHKKWRKIQRRQKQQEHTQRGYLKRGSMVDQKPEQKAGKRKNKGAKSFLFRCSKNFSPNSYPQNGALKLSAHYSRENCVQKLGVQNSKINTAPTIDQ
jgi:hypothetical protein